MTVSRMRLTVRTAVNRSDDSPQAIDGSEGDQQPAGQIAARLLGSFQAYF